MTVFHVYLDWVVFNIVLSFHPLPVLPMLVSIPRFVVLPLRNATPREFVRRFSLRPQRESGDGGEKHGVWNLRRSAWM